MNKDEPTEGDIRKLFNLPENPAEPATADQQAAMAWLLMVWRTIRSAGASDAEAAGIMAALVIASRSGAGGPA